jgi:hypothetical protein
VIDFRCERLASSFGNDSRAQHPRVIDPLQANELNRGVACKEGFHKAFGFGRHLWSLALRECLKTRWEDAARDELVNSDQVEIEISVSQANWA